MGAQLTTCSSPAADPEPILNQRQPPMKPPILSRSSSQSSEETYGEMPTEFPFWGDHLSERKLKSVHSSSPRFVATYRSRQAACDAMSPPPDSNTPTLDADLEVKAGQTKTKKATVTQKRPTTPKIRASLKFFQDPQTPDKATLAKSPSLMRLNPQLRSSISRKAKRDSRTISARASTGRRKSTRRSSKKQKKKS